MARQSRAVNKTANSGNLGDKLALATRLANNFLLYPLIFPEGAIEAPNILTSVGAALAFTTAPKTSVVRAQLKIIDRGATKVLSRLIDYVNNIATGDQAIISLSGIQINKAATNKNKLGSVTNLRQFITPNIATGDVKINWNKPKGTKTKKGISYRVQLYPTGHPNLIREVGITNKTSITFPAGDLNVIGMFVRVTPVNGVPSPWIIAKAQF